jgi:hypothetical protein
MKKESARIIILPRRKKINRREERKMKIPKKSREVRDHPAFFNSAEKSGVISGKALRCRARLPVRRSAGRERTFRGGAAAPAKMERGTSFPGPVARHEKKRFFGDKVS